MDYRKLIVNHTAFIFKEKKDVDTQMWKNCFYKQIEDFRRSIRKNSSDLSNSQLSDPRVEKQRFYLVQLTTALISFLSDSTVFYQDMMLEVNISTIRIFFSHSTVKIMFFIVQVGVACRRSKTNWWYACGSGIHREMCLSVSTIPGRFIQVNFVVLLM